MPQSLSMEGMSASSYSEVPSVADIAGDLGGVLDRFRRGEIHSFAFGPEGGAS